MEFDFTTLNNIANDRIISPIEQKQTHSSAYNPIAKQREAEEQSRQTYATYQDNVRSTGQLRSEIVKGIQNAQNPLNLLLKAIECISLMTDDKLLYIQARADIIAIYGTGLHEHEPLEIELKEVQARLDRLLEAERQELEVDQKQRIKYAVESHKSKIKAIKTVLLK